MHMNNRSEKFSIPMINRIRWQDVTLGGILLLAGGLRLLKYSSRPIFLDEEATTNLAELTPIELWVNIARVDPHPPLYYLFSHYWGEITNLTVANIRLTSVFFGTIAVYGMYRIGRDLYSEQIGLLSSLLLAVSPHHIASSQYARSYALFSLFTIFSFYYFWKLQKSSSTSDLIGYIFFTTAMASVHIYGSFLVLGQWAYFVIAYTKLESKISVRRFLKSQLSVGLLFIPSFLVVIQAALL